MKIDKFNEKYEMDTDFKSEISTEYAKLILSEYIDKYDDEDDNKDSLQKVYVNIIKNDELDESQELMIIESLEDFTTELINYVKKLKTVEEYNLNQNVEKYNV